MRTRWDTGALSNEELVHFWVLMTQPSRLAQFCQLMPDEENCEGDTEDRLCCKDAQELLAAVPILGLLQLKR